MTASGKSGANSPVVLSPQEPPPEVGIPYNAATPSLPTQSVPSMSPQTGPQLDEIVEGLARRFGWTAPGNRGEQDDELPRYS